MHALHSTYLILANGIQGSNHYAGVKAFKDH